LLIIDARFLDSGIGTYTRQIVKAVHLTVKQPWAVVCRNAEQKGKLEEYVNAPIEVFRFIDAGMYSLGEQFKMSRIPKEHTLLTCHYTAPFFFKGPLVVSILDLAHLDLPGVFTSRIKRLAARILIKRALKKAKTVLTISRFSRQRILEVFGSRFADKVKNIYIAAEEPAVPGKKINKDYILYVGNLKPHKNLPRLLEAFAKLKEDNKWKKLKLYIIGQKAFSGTVLDIEEKAFKDVVFPGYVSDKELASLYKNARCLCLPSLYEGFGLPPLEALHYGTPVLVSDIPIFKETLEKNANYCDPSRVDSIAGGLETILTAKKPAVNKKQVTALLKKFNFGSFVKRFKKALKGAL